MALAFIWLCDIPRSLSFVRGPVLLLCFFLAFAYADFRTPEQPPPPAWLTQYSLSRIDRVLPIVAEVGRCDLLPGNRARITLTHARPAEPLPGAPANTRYEAYDAPLLWTWRHPPDIPLPGDTIRGLFRLGPVRGFLNPGSWDSGEYWRNRGIWYRARDNSKAVPEIIKTAKGGFSPAAWRYALQDAFKKALPVVTPDETASDNRVNKQNANPSVTSRTTDLPAAQEEPRPSEGASLLPALIFGDKSGISAVLNELFAKATLSHSLALSGLHLGFAVLAGAAFSALACAIRPSLCLVLPRSHLTLLFSLPFALLYLWLGQAPYSLLRAAAMLLFSVVIVFLKRPGALLDGLFAALALILAVHPLAFFEIGLQLSALCIVSMALVLPRLTRFAHALFPARSLPARLGRWAFMLLGISLCIQIALLPLTARYFGTTGLLFPLNLVWLPALGLYILPLSFLGLLAIALQMPEFAGLLLKLASLPCDALVSLLHWLDAAGMLQSQAMPRPHWLSCIGYWLLLVTVPLLFSCLRASRRQDMAGKPQIGLYAAASLLGLTALLLPVGAAIHANRQPAVTLEMLDVGQGQALVLGWSGIGPDRQAGRIIVDGGGFPGSGFDVGKAVVAPVLTDNALPRLDAVVSTHADIDHAGGLMYLLETFSVQHYFSNGDITPNYRAQRESNALVRSGLVKETLSAGRSLEPAPGLHLEILWPEEGNTFAPGNNSSLVIRLVWDGHPLALMCGDIEIAAIQKILEAYSPADLKAHALVLPHHGAGSSYLPEFYQAVAPAVALASTGYSNRWNFPSKPVREALSAQGVPLLTTADKGRVSLRWSSPRAKPELVTVIE